MAWKTDIPEAEYYDLRSPGLDGLVREIQDLTRAATDTETDGLDKINCIPYYWSLGWTSSDGRDRRVTMPAETMVAFKSVIADPNRSWVFANAKFDAHMFENAGYPLRGKLIDVAVMHALLYEEKPHDLKSMCRASLGLHWTDFQDTFGKLRAGVCVCGGTKASHMNLAGICKKTGCTSFRQLTALDLLRRAEIENFSKLVDYSANDSYGTWKLLHVLEKELSDAPAQSRYNTDWPHIWTLKDYYYKTELPFTRVLYACERNGLKVDRAYLEGITPGILDSLTEIKKKLNSETGRMMKTSGDTLIDYFISEKGLRPHKMTSGGKSGKKKPSIDGKYLEWVADNYPNAEVGRVASLLIEYGLISKQYSTYIQKMPGRLDRNGYVHMSLNQDVARCMPAGELVLTDKGYIPVEEVRVGDLVLAHTGKARRVLHTSKHAPQPIYKVRLANGLVLRTNGSHPYLVGRSWVRADRLRRGYTATVHSSKPETWKRIPEWPSYQVSSWGRILNSKTGSVLAQQKKGDWGHLKVTLSRNGAQKRGDDRKDVAVHRLVASCFCKKASCGDEVRHLDGIAWNNTVDNLLYGTSKENTADSRAHGTLNGAPKLTPAQVKSIRAANRRGQPASSTAKLSYPTAERMRTLHANGVTLSDLARAYGVSVQAVSHIVHGKVWSKPIEGVSAVELGATHAVSAACIRDIWAGRRWNRNIPKAMPAKFSTARVIDIKVEPPEPTYGLCVEEDHSHVTGGIVTHNTGRLSSSDPNMQNVTSGEKDRFHLRNAFIAEYDEDMVVSDYKQLEQRLLGAASQEPAMMDIFHRGWDIHMGNASLVFGYKYEDIDEAKNIDKKVKGGSLPPEAMTQHFKDCLKARGDVKTISFGLNYGMKAPAMAARMGCSIEEAEAKIEQYMAAYPAVRKFFAEAVEEAREYEAVYTILGRRRQLPDINSQYNFTRFRAERQASNMPIQGSAAEVCKMAMIHLYEDADLRNRLEYKMRLQVHDEVIGTCPKTATKEVQARIKDWMEHPFPSDIGVPLEIDMGVGPSWGHAK